MRRILVENARRKARVKHEGELPRHGRRGGLGRIRLGKTTIRLAKERREIP
jgi:hypothetical protein